MRFSLEVNGYKILRQKLGFMTTEVEVGWATAITERK